MATTQTVDKFGVYKDSTDGTYYLADGTPLLQYNTSTGVYQEDVTPYDSTIYSAAGLPIGDAVKGDTVTSVGGKSLTVWYVLAGVSGLALVGFLYAKFKKK